MNLKELTIEGYKSIGKITISNPNPFTVFVGPNASGKSNIFEALEFLQLCKIMDTIEVSKQFGNPNEFLNQLNAIDNVFDLRLKADIQDIKPDVLIQYSNFNGVFSPYASSSSDVNTERDNSHWGDSQSEKIQREAYSKYIEKLSKNPNYIHFFNFTRLFVGHPSRLSRKDDSRLNTDADNLEKVLKRILKDEKKREEIFEILQLLIPGFERVEIVSSELSGTDTLIVYETALKKPLTKELISDGTFNILAIIAALYQTDEPQFLCIEEPENGLNPFVVKELVNIIRDICEEKGHYVWLNTHSQSLVSVLTKEEIIIVDKKNGLTEIKQIQDMNLHGLRMDDALYTNSIGGGNPW